MLVAMKHHLGVLHAEGAGRGAPVAGPAMVASAVASAGRRSRSQVVWQGVSWSDELTLLDVCQA